MNLLIALKNIDEKEDYINRVMDENDDTPRTGVVGYIRQCCPDIENIFYAHSKYNVRKVCEQEKIDKVLLSEFLEMRSPYTPEELNRLDDIRDDMVVVPILSNEHYATSFMGKIHASAIYNAIFEKDASIEEVCHILNGSGRKKREARFYYGIYGVMEVSETSKPETQNYENDIREKALLYIKDGESIREQADRFLQVQENLVSSDIKKIRESLSEEVSEQVKELEKHITEEERKEEEKVAVSKKRPEPIEEEEKKPQKEEAELETAVVMQEAEEENESVETAAVSEHHEHEIVQKKPEEKIFKKRDLSLPSMPKLTLPKIKKPEFHKPEKFEKPKMEVQMENPPKPVAKKAKKEPEHTFVKQRDFEKEPQNKGEVRSVKEKLELEKEPLPGWVGETFLAKENERIIMRGTTDIGFMGVDRGVGTTHTALLCAYSLAKDYRVAYVEIGRHSQIGGFLTRTEGETACREGMTHKGVDIYSPAYYEDFCCDHKKDYDYVVVDFGNFEYDKIDWKDEKLRTFLSMQTSIMVASAAVWKENAIERFLSYTHNHKNAQKIIYAIPFATEMRDKKWLENTCRAHKMGSVPYDPKFEQPGENTVDFFFSLVDASRKFTERKKIKFL